MKRRVYRDLRYAPTKEIAKKWMDKRAKRRMAKLERQAAKRHVTGELLAAALLGALTLTACAEDGPPSSAPQVTTTTLDPALVREAEGEAHALLQEPPDSFLQGRTEDFFGRDSNNLSEAASAWGLHSSDLQNAADELEDLGATEAADALGSAAAAAEGVADCISDLGGAFYYSDAADQCPTAYDSYVERVEVADEQVAT